MFNSRLFAVVVLAVTCSQAPAGVIVNFDGGTTQITPQIDSIFTSGADMDGMAVTAFFLSGGSETSIWSTTGAQSGAAAGTGWSISYSGPDTGNPSGNPFIIESTGVPLSRLWIDAGTGMTVFDTNSSIIGTPGSSTGLTALEKGNPLGLSVIATYRDQVALDGSSPVGDLYRSLHLEFTSAPLLNGTYSLGLDTDTATGSVNAIPEPSSFAILLTATAGIAVLELRRRDLRKSCWNCISGINGMGSTGWLRAVWRQVNILSSLRGIHEVRRPATRVLEFFMKFRLLFTVIIAAACTSVGSAGVIVSPYLQSSDSPFSATSFEYFFLEDMEDGINSTGLSATGGGLTNGNPNRDSVDADDGSVDGNGSGGVSYASQMPNPTHNFTFSSTILGRLPTHAGVVWTDGAKFGLGEPVPVTFSFFDGANVLLDSTTLNLGDGQFTGQTAEDRFVGLQSSLGISRIQISTNSSATYAFLETDHVQYGVAAVPEPSTFAFFTGAAVLLSLLRKRRTKP